jgi:hypothetical protein
MLRRSAPVLALVLALTLFGWYWAVPAVASASTFAAVVVFLLAVTSISFMTWRNAQATGSTAQLLHATEGASDNVELRKRLERKDASGRV